MVSCRGCQEQDKNNELFPYIMRRQPRIVLDLSRLAKGVSERWGMYRGLSRPATLGVEKALLSIYTSPCAGIANLNNPTEQEAVPFDCHDKDVLSLYISCLAYGRCVRLTGAFFPWNGCYKTRAHVYPTYGC